MLCTISMACFAEIYPAVYEYGRVEFADKPSVEVEVVEVKVNSIQGPATVTDFKSTSNADWPG